MRGWKVDRGMAIWGVCFAVFTIITGTFIVRAMRGGFLAEGFFLIVVSWVVFFVLIAKLVVWIERRTRKDKHQPPGEAHGRRRDEW